MGSAFLQLCPRYSGTLTPTAPTAIRLWDTFTFYLFYVLSSFALASFMSNALNMAILFPDQAAVTKYSNIML